jgi:hypothetical protein
MEAIYVAKVADNRWTTVELGAHYYSAIPACTVQYPWEEGRKAAPAIVRVQNIRPNTFEIRLQSPRGDNLPERPVHCIVVEQGSWIMPGGRTIEANQYVSTRTDHSESFEGEIQQLKNSFLNPIIIGQVLSYNDPGWSVFWSQGGDVKSGDAADSVYTGKHVGNDKRKNRSNESVGYIVFEGGHDSTGGIEIEAARGGTVKDYINGSQPYIFESKFITAPMVAVLSVAGMEDPNGCWAVLCSNPTHSLMFVATDNDRNGDNTSLAHISKSKIDYVAFSVTGTVSLQSTRSMSKHQWYLPNIFSQGEENGNRKLNEELSLENSTPKTNKRLTSKLRRSHARDHVEHLPDVDYPIIVFMILTMCISLAALKTIRNRLTAQLPLYNQSR